MADGGEASGQTTSTTGRLDFLWRVIGRYDVLLGATLARGGVVATIGTFLIGGLALKWTDILATFTGHRLLGSLALGTLLVVASLALVATALALTALVPFLGSSGSSRIFFGDVARRRDNATYARELVASTEEELAADLSGQVHTLAHALKSKYASIRRSSHALVAAIVLVAVVILLRAIGFALDLGSGGLP